MSTIYDMEEEILFKSVLDSISDGVTIIDPDFKVIFQNANILKKFGNVKGRYCFEAYRGREVPCATCTIHDVLKDGKPRKVLSDVKTPNGDVRWMECMSDALKNKEGKIIGAVEIVRDVTEQMHISEEWTILKRELDRQVQFEDIITQSHKMKTIFKLVSKIAPTNSSVLISGESGTGKELIAKAIHSNSNRKDKPFVAVNCGAIPENLLESELFGHIKGAFTGAIKNHPGLISTAHEGTLFLDEIGEIPLNLQVKLLRFLQEGTCRRVGDTELQKFDVRIIAATNRNLEESVRDGIFREDLYFRLNVIPVYLPPLRDRKEDIPPLANHILHKLCKGHDRKITGIDAKALKRLMDYSWPGNIRELENVIEYSLHIADDGDTIQLVNLPPQISGDCEQSNRPSKFLSIDEFTKQSILALQDQHKEEEIAEILGISRKNLWEKRKRWGIVKPLSNL